MISSRNNASIINFSILFDEKVNLVGQNLKFTVVLKSAGKKQKNRNFYAKLIFFQNR